jgi:hypothetical protein
LVQDAAHVLQGAVGDHVGKIQTALEALDHARIDKREVLAQKYGHSTANAVLDYKTKRRIINFTYQTQADNIVGKMTIAALDSEMAAFENRSLRHPNCGDPVGSSGGSEKTFVPGSQRLRDSPAVTAPTAGEKFPANLGLIWDVTAEAEKRGATQHLSYLTRAAALLQDSGMGTLVTVSPDALPNRDVVDPRFKSDTFRVRKASEDKQPGFPNRLRVIVCPFDSTSDAFGVTEGGTLDGQTFRFFVLLNVNKLRADKGTLLHEMIHAATGLGEADHDPDQQSVFSVGSNRSLLKPEHAKALSKSFFATPKS